MATNMSFVFQVSGFRFQGEYILMYVCKDLFLVVEDLLLREDLFLVVEDLLLREDLFLVSVGVRDTYNVQCTFNMRLCDNRKCMLVFHMMCVYML